MTILNRFLHFANKLCETTTTTDDNAVISPLYKFIDLVGPYAIGVCTALCLIYGIILGVQYARSETTDERKATQKRLISFVIGAVAILILIVLLYALRGPLSNWANSIDN